MQVVICPKCKAELYFLTETPKHGGHMDPCKFIPRDDSIPVVHMGSSVMCPKCQEGYWLTKDNRIHTTNGLVP